MIVIEKVPKKLVPFSKDEERSLFLVPLLVIIVHFHFLLHSLPLFFFSRSIFHLSVAGLGDWTKFVFWIIFSKISSIKCRIFVAKCTVLKIQCWPVVKICPEIMNFVVFAQKK